MRTTKKSKKQPALKPESLELPTREELEEIVISGMLIEKYFKHFKAKASPELLQQFTKCLYEMDNPIYTRIAEFLSSKPSKPKPRKPS